MDEKPSRLTSPLAALLLVAAAALAILAVALPVYQVAQSGATVTVNVAPAASQAALNTVPGLHLEQESDELPIPVTLQPTGDDGLTVNAVSASAPWQLRILTALGTAIWAAGLAGIAYLLARILANIAHGEPFHESHARRFTLIGCAILVASVGADAVNLLAARVFTEHYATPDPLQVTPYFSLIPLALACVTFVLAGAFRSGRRMAADVEGLV